MAPCSMLKSTCYNGTAKGGDFPDTFIDDAIAIKTRNGLFVHAVGWQSLGSADYAETSRP